MTFLIAFLLAAIFTVLINRQAAMALPSPQRQMLIGHLVALALASSLFACFAAISARPFLALWLTTGVSGLLWATNRLKMDVLHEPLVFSDIFLAGQVIGHPHLYIAHATTPPRIIAGLWVTIFLGILFLEAKNTALNNYTRMILGICAIIPWSVFGAMLIGLIRHPLKKMLEKNNLSFNPSIDAARFTPIGASLLHAVHHNKRLKNGVDDLLRTVQYTTKDIQNVKLESDIKPHVLIVQAESFCDIRRFIPSVSSEIMPNIRLAMSQGTYGNLLLEWSGAYTMRTEFSVLTGLDLRRMETFSFDPYLLAAQRPITSMAHRLRKLGYHSICLHPYDPKFFRRDMVMNNLGFDQFMGMEHFSVSDRNGPYVSDRKVLDVALNLMKNSTEPLFVFVITMEAHGPWLPDRFSKEGQKTGTSLGHYLRHLASLDEGVGEMMRQSKQLEREMVLALYGDHVPSLDAVLDNSSASKATDYFFWSSRSSIKSKNHLDLRPELLANKLIHTIFDDTK
ncbi:LTA synthase family protein [Desulfomicrobium sp. ZS1]|uniref:LTA synthase family protein n=1 Tax=Desulfomicrobium sp. ZS1 TaxID=2952228 RepID=UPI0020B1D2AD|nr:LTA synthase family protein [Desulfomicrobium sp. ZS1]UTF51192.1 LTA synthase family protein [Desulfomicrobium sp. ZS1]